MVVVVVVVVAVVVVVVVGGGSGGGGGGFGTPKGAIAPQSLHGGNSTPLTQHLGRFHGEAADAGKAGEAGARSAVMERRPPGDVKFGRA